MGRKVKNPDRILEVGFSLIILVVCLIVFSGILAITILVPPTITNNFWSMVVKVLGIIFSCTSCCSVLVSIVILVCVVRDVTVNISGEGD